MNSPRTVLHLLIGQLQSSFKKLNVQISPHSIEVLASTIYQVLSARERRYHTIRHASDASILKDPAWTLAASFYDLVYLQTDKRVHPLIRPALEGFVIDEDLSVVVPNAQAENTPYYLKLALRVFEVAPGKKLKLSAEENKFLSAVVAAYFLCDLIDSWDLFRVLVCIQSTVPILGLAHLEAHSGERILQRLELINIEFNWGKSKAELRKLVELAMSVAHHDRMVFAAPPEEFLAQVMNLMLETHPVLRNPACSVRQMRMSFQQYYEYLRSLDSHSIFQRLGGQAYDLEYARLKKKVDQNLGLAVRFFTAILVSLYFLECLSLLTGGDAPYLLMTGHSSVWESLLAQKETSRIPAHRQGFVDHSSSSVQTPAKEALSFVQTRGDLHSDGVFSLLLQKFSGVEHSGLGSFFFVAYFYSEMTDSENHQVIALIDQYSKGELSGLDFLSSAYPQDLLSVCLRRLSEVAVTRTHLILEVRDQLQFRNRPLTGKRVA